MRQPRVKEKTVKLISSKGHEQDFTIQHAERLLDMGPQLNGGWKIDPKSDYYYTDEYGIRLKADKKHSAETE